MSACDETEIMHLCMGIHVIMNGLSLISCIKYLFKILSIGSVFTLRLQLHRMKSDFCDNAK